VKIIHLVCASAKTGSKTRTILLIMNRRLSADISVKELLDRYPILLQTFIDLGLLCVGCPTEAFHTVADVAKEYGYDPNKLTQHFQRIIDASEASTVSKP
jgi:hybrid cluster-associated redox disulfide protein